MAATRSSFESESAASCRLRPCVVKVAARDRVGEVAVGLLDQEHIAVRGRIAVKGQRVGIAAGIFDLTGVVEPQFGLAKEVERDVGKRYVFFHDRRMRDPCSAPLSENK